MGYADEAIIKLRTEAELRERASSTDLSKVQVICGEEYPFAPRLFFDKRLELTAPQGMSPMPEELAAEKYLAAQKPQVILTNRDYTADITLNLLDGALEAAQAHLCLQKLKSTIRKAFPATLFFDEGQLDAVGASVSYMDFKSFSLGGPAYNIMFVSAICKGNVRK